MQYACHIAIIDYDAITDSSLGQLIYYISVFVLPVAQGISHGHHGCPFSDLMRCGRTHETQSKHKSLATALTAMHNCIRSGCGGGIGA